MKIFNQILKVAQSVGNNKIVSVLAQNRETDLKNSQNHITVNPIAHLSIYRYNNSFQLRQSSASCGMHVIYFMGYFFLGLAPFQPLFRCYYINAEIRCSQNYNISPRSFVSRVNSYFKNIKFPRGQLSPKSSPTETLYHLNRLCRDLIQSKPSLNTFY